jgi:hypothetical protein
MPTKSVSDLVRVVARRLRRDAIPSPSASALTKLFETVYFTSLKTEEGQPLQARVALVDPANPDPDRPPSPRPDRWKITKLDQRLPLTVPSLVKLSKAADPWSSCLAVYFDSSGEFFIWGLVDQTVHFNTGLVREREFGYAPPGLFQVVAMGTADLSVYQGHEFVARLAQDSLLQRQSDVFWSGPISDQIATGVDAYSESVWNRLARVPHMKKFISDSRGDRDWESTIAGTWISTLCRLLISIQRYRHGGALLLTKSKADLDIKYKINYSRLRGALTRLWVSRLLAYVARSEISEEFLDREQDMIPSGLYLDETIEDSNEEDYRDEITGCVRFISSLSCVDGLILATPDLSIRGFGVEIRSKKDPDAVYLSPGPKALDKSLRKIDPSHYGTRHRSMMRFCFAHPKSVGFVVSQDGEIRAMTRVRSRLVMWENLKVLDFIENFARRLPKSGTKGQQPGSSEDSKTAKTPSTSS